jgi:hypothetical protein
MKHITNSNISHGSEEFLALMLPSMAEQVQISAIKT